MFYALSSVFFLFISKQVYVGRHGILTGLPLFSIHSPPQIPNCQKVAFSNIYSAMTRNSWMEITLRQMPGKPSQNPALLTTWLGSQGKQMCCLPVGMGLQVCSWARAWHWEHHHHSVGAPLPETGAAAPEQHHQLHPPPAVPSGRQHGKLHEGSLVFHTTLHELVTFFWVSCR